MKNLKKVINSLLVVGGINWGLVGALKFDLVKAIFGTSVLTNIVYIAVGASALYVLFAYLASAAK